MGKLVEKEQVLLAYYVCNFLEKNEKNEGELREALNNVGENLTSIQTELSEKGLLSDHDRMITNEGILYLDNILHIQSDAVERNKLAYVKDNLLTYDIELSVPGIKEYIHKHVGIE
ncbi:hypothetical protein SAMN05518871_105221 [Psychrobacillus sp. OK028]|uniref:hypothetical protein n=1 Tax=Psychrobacillus sp. OK028 TaxID=1884359 RepID=UPI00088FD935|nr:hypothetical protein [Psychrobacillus sp. OK028]SDN47250.1 hypothetical protein SAMN05518871_105221 [Psychrobacillus sp. OK028]